MNFRNLLWSTGFVLLAQIALAQTNSCTVSNLSVQVGGFNTQNCTVTFAVSYDHTVNAGNKMAYIHIWDEASYHSTGDWSAVYTKANSAPNATQLGSALATIVIETNNTGVLNIGSSYYPAPTVPVSTQGLVVTKTPLATGDRITISNLQLVIPNCTSTGAIKLKGDIWESQANRGSTVHCSNQGLAFAVNFPRITSALKVCEPRSLSFAIQNNSTAALNLGFNIYQDDGDGSFEGSATGASLDPLVFQQSATAIAAGAFLSRSQLQFPALQVAGEKSSYWLQATAPTLSYTTVAYIDQNAAGCVPLPVSLNRFSADRNAAMVTLNWQTEWEQNNKGFDIQRNEGGGWNSVGFVISSAANGNSTTTLDYSFQDVNNRPGSTQYRLVQQDMDGRSKFSATIIVAGYQSAVAITVFPNPAPKGTAVNVAFAGNGKNRNIILNDLQGRAVREWKSFSGSSLRIEKLQPGLYSLQVIDIATGERSTERVLVTQ